jgi:hypothetical protein
MRKGGFWISKSEPRQIRLFWVVESQFAMADSLQAAQNTFDASTVATSVALNQTAQTYPTPAGGAGAGVGAGIVSGLIDMSKGEIVLLPVMADDGLATKILAMAR